MSLEREAGGESCRNRPSWLRANQLAAALEASVSPQTLAVSLGLPFSAAWLQVIVSSRQFPSSFHFCISDHFAHVNEALKHSGKKSKRHVGMDVCALLLWAALAGLARRRQPHTHPAEEGAQEDFLFESARSGCQGWNQFHTRHVSLRVTCHSYRTTSPTGATSHS